VNTETLYKLLKSNQDLVKEIEEISYGDRWYNEQGESINFTISGKNYCVGYSYITEDAEDWGQAECNQVTWCREDNHNIKPIEVYNIVQHHKELEREWKLNQIL
jgi:hypothetical protein